ncbi:MAG: HIT domain-containing protein [Candidatus Cloacimonetes bacterium]|nr:HIT domain-containing protein [Candidatus Cloacimonadota bacterium]MBS3767050.1 HIT domain-containing protein [Candidatus Cloacimonadota bacterium]
MKHLYSPWRMKYILENKGKKCVFCVKQEDTNDAKHFILRRGEYSYVIMNLYPYNSAHLLVVPYKHVSTLQELPDEELTEMMQLVKLSEKVLTKVYKPDGFNIGMNIGEAAGAGIAEHLHVHIVPRWKGDTNFFTTINGTRVIPEDMKIAYKKLKKVFDEEK